MGLIVVSRFKGRPKFYCRICTMLGETTVFFDGEDAAYMAHVTACADRHADALRARSPRHQMPAAFDPAWEGGDVEWGRWLRDHGPEILEGRKNMKTRDDGL